MEAWHEMSHMAGVQKTCHPAGWRPRSIRQRTVEGDYHVIIFFRIRTIGKSEFYSYSVLHVLAAMTTPSFPAPLGPFHVHLACSFFQL